MYRKKDVEAVLAIKRLLYDEGYRMCFEDVDYCLRLDCFDFVMRVASRDGLLVAVRHDV